MPFKSDSFNLVVFDPPHLINVGKNSWLSKKYGKLDKDTWQNDIKLGFKECFRVLKENGTLIFKWNEEQIKLNEILKLTDYKPIFGNRSKTNRTHFVVFVKNDLMKEERQS